MVSFTLSTQYLLSVLATWEGERKFTTTPKNVPRPHLGEKSDAETVIVTVTAVRRKRVMQRQS